MIKSKSGFTIVELLIVIVVIGILAAITIVAYNGLQARARNSVRVGDIKNIQKALELYKIDNGDYPPTSASPSANGCTGGGYSFSWATDGTWMSPLTNANYISRTPIDPANGCTHYYRYLHINSGWWGCSSSGYMLQVQLPDAGSVPTDAVTAIPSNCTSWPASFMSSDGLRWNFAKFTT